MANKNINIIPSGRGLEDNEEPATENEVLNAIVKPTKTIDTTSEDEPVVQAGPVESPVESQDVEPEEVPQPEATPNPVAVDQPVMLGTGESVATKEYHPGDPIIIENLIDSGHGFSVVDTPNGKFKLEGGTISWRNNNPGNINYGPLSEHHKGFYKDYKGYAVFKSYEDGVNAQKALLFSEDSRYYSLTLSAAIARYAPTSDGNDPRAYANFVAKKAGLPRNIVLGKLSDSQQNDLIEAMKAMEGFQLGTVTPYGT